MTLMELFTKWKFR